MIPLSQLDLPCFVYDPAVVAANVVRVRRAFPLYHYPLKCNPHPELVRAAVDAGAELDLCSIGDLDIAVALDALSPRTSYTGAGVSDEMLARLSTSGCRVNLNSLHEVSAWARLSGSRACGVRVELPAGERTYGSKFGMSGAEIERARELCPIAGLHVHDSHRGRTPAEAAGALAAALRTVPRSLLAGLQYISLGGGWAHAYEGEAPWDLSVLAASVDEHVVAALRRDGFDGELLVEPGEFVVAAAGVWLACVVSAKRAGAERIVILDTPTPVPCADFAYPMRLLRDGETVTSQTDVWCTIHGSSNSGRDRIRRCALPAEPQPGDVVAICDAGAYVRSLIAPFNERQIPAQYASPLGTMAGG